MLHTWDLKKAPLSDNSFFVTLVGCHTVHLQASEKAALSSQTDREMVYDAKWRNNVQENQMHPNKKKLRVIEALTFSTNNKYCLLVLSVMVLLKSQNTGGITVFSKWKCRNTSPLIEEPWDNQLKDAILLFSLVLQAKLQLKVLEEQSLQFSVNSSLFFTFFFITC